ncbi:MAG: hypothetical protein IJN19_01245 [Opitutales bacterium]|nr:hypothetical protein [Opitutales bacterium]
MKKTTKTAATKCCAKKKTTTAEKKTATAGKKVTTKAAVKAPAAKTTKKAVKKTTAPVAKKAAKKVTRIIANVDVGWGNMLYIRGEGAGLSWEQGVPMLCNNDTEWHWTAETDAEPISFKFLVNDEKWASGENVTINAGDVHISTPTF